MYVHDSVVIGAGQAGLSSSYHLKRLGLDHVVLDADERPGGAWRHRWNSLTMADVHGVADLPDAPAPGGSDERANVAVPAWFGGYEAAHALPVERPVRVDRVTSEGDLLVVHAGPRSWRARTIVNATGTWTRPFLPYSPGAAGFRGEHLHPGGHRARPRAGARGEAAGERGQRDRLGAAPAGAAGRETGRLPSSADVRPDRA